MTTTLDRPVTTVRVAQYLRVSLDKTARGASTDQQRNDNERAITEHEREGWALVATYLDNSRSASPYATREREDYTRLLADLERGAFDVLVLWESSRGSRTVLEWAQLLILCQRMGVRIYVTTHGRLYDPCNGRDERTLYEDATDSQYESRKVSTRVRRDAAAAAAAGKPHGRCPYGYERLYDPHTKKFTEQRPLPDQAAVVIEIFDEIARGESLRALTAKLNERDIPTATGKRWSPHTVRQIALSAAYIGVRTHNGTRTQGVWPPLVSEATFYAVQRILSDPARVTTRPGRAKWLLSMIARCGAVLPDGTTCGNPMAVTYRANTGRRATYQCKGLNHLRIDREDLDVHVTEWVIDYLTEHKDRLCAPQTDDATVMADLDEKARLDARLAEYVEAADQMNPADFIAVQSKIRAQIDEVDARIRAATTPPALDFLLNGDGPIVDLWRDAPMPSRREVVKLLASITVLRSPSRGHRVDPTERVSIEPLR